MATAEKVLETARKELGTKESPANSNKTKYGRWYGMNGQPWCMMFVQWCFAQAGMALPYKTASCSLLLSWYRKSRPGSVVKTPQPGDIVIYNFSHTGIVESVGGGTITALEGNTSSSEAGSQSNGGMVCRKTRKTSLVTAYIRPDYGEEDMDISKLTDSDVLALADRMQTLLGKKTVSAALSQELAEARAAGITDGTNPYAFCTRAQAAVMTLRAAKK